jgi:molecular chaperone DnaJ
MTGKDFYQTLGINKNASAEEIKQAYRKLAREHHPDMAKEADKAAAEAKFKEVNEAYQVLSDPQKRATYDQYGSAAFNQGGGNPGGFGGAQGNWGPFSYSYSSGGQEGFGDFDPMDIFDQFFGGRRAPKKGKTLYYQMSVPFADAVFGFEKEIKVESGKVNIKVPAGIKEGTEMRFPGHGMPGPNNTPAGDLVIAFHVEAPAEFNFFDENILIRQEIDFVQATLGDNIEIPVVDLNNKTGLGTAKLKIPEGTQYGARFVVRGKGMPRLRGRGQGDIVVEVFIRIPKKLSRHQKEILEKYKQS